MIRRGHHGADEVREGGDGAGDQGADFGQGVDLRVVDSGEDVRIAWGGTAQREARGNLGCQRKLLGTRHVREGRGTEGRGAEVGGVDLAKYWFTYSQEDGEMGGTREPPMAVPTGCSGSTEDRCRAWGRTRLGYA